MGKPNRQIIQCCGAPDSFLSAYCETPNRQNAGHDSKPTTSALLSVHRCCTSIRSRHRLCLFCPESQWAEGHAWHCCTLDTGQNQVRSCVDVYVVCIFVSAFYAWISPFSLPFVPGYQPLSALCVCLLCLDISLCSAFCVCLLCLDIGLLSAFCVKACWPKPIGKSPPAAHCFSCGQHSGDSCGVHKFRTATGVTIL